MEREPRPARWPIFLAVAFLACLVVALFHPTLGFEFVNLDVTGQVTNNPHVQGLTAENLRHIFTSWCVRSYYPVRTLTYALDYQLWGGLNAKGFKLTNVLIHLANTLLLFWLILRLSDHPAAAGRAPERWWKLGTAVFSAGIFAAHPVVVEPVAWVPGREELLMTLGALGCLHFHLTARRLSDEGGRAAGVAAHHLGAAFCCAAACLSNAVGAVIPLLITAWDVLMLRRPKLGRILYGTSLLWILGVTTIVLKKVGASVDPHEPHYGLFSAQRLMVILEVYWLNLKTLVWPTHLAIDYWNIIPQGFTKVQVILGGVALGLTCLLLWMLRRRKLLLFGLVWFGLALAPTSQIMPHHLDRADRFLYLPLVGLAAAVAMALRPVGNALAGRGARGTVIAAGVLGLLLLGVRSAGQVRTWRNSLSMWENCVRLVPSNAFAHGCLADTLAEQGRFDEALPYFETAVRIDPYNTKTLNNFAYRLAVCRQEELRDYDRAIRLARRGCELTEWKDRELLRTLATAYMNLATALKGEGKLEGAVQNYRNAIEADSEYEVPSFNLAMLLATSSDEKFRRPDEAVRLAEQACALVEEPDSIQLSILAQVYAETGRLGQAVSTTQKAIRLAQEAGNSEMADALRGRLKQYQNGTPSKSSAD